MSASTPQAAPLRSRLWANVTGSNFRVKKWKKLGEKVKREVDENKAYIPIEAYIAFSRDYDTFTAALESYEGRVLEGAWTAVTHFSGTFVMAAERVAAIGKSTSSTAAMLRNSCILKHQTVEKIGGRCPVCFAEEFGVFFPSQSAHNPFTNGHNTPGPDAHSARGADNNAVTPRAGSDGVHLARSSDRPDSSLQYSKRIDTRVDMMGGGLYFDNHEGFSGHVGRDVSTFRWDYSD
ncbi:hypothetical protein FB451DRAFT_1260101 [Mycena latifolia]|nr:hypothetical protein FB451DRAFT_1260101 [Mycena latifolia]